jgi:transcriptional regulator with XRE-family HTH domain
MAKRYKSRAPARRHFLRHWREHRGLSQDQVAEAIGISKASVSRVENGITPYTQDVLEAYARVLGCTVADLVSRPPSDPEGLWAIWDRLRAEDRRRAVVILRALVDPNLGYRSDEKTLEDEEIAEQRL